MQTASSPAEQNRKILLYTYVAQAGRSSRGLNMGVAVSNELTINRNIILVLVFFRKVCLNQANNSREKPSYFCFIFIIFLRKNNYVLTTVGKENALSK